MIHHWFGLPQVVSVSKSLLFGQSFALPMAVPSTPLPPPLPAGSALRPCPPDSCLLREQCDLTKWSASTASRHCFAVLCALQMLPALIQCASCPFMNAVRTHINAGLKAGSADKAIATTFTKGTRCSCSVHVVVQYAAIAIMSPHHFLLSLVATPSVLVVRTRPS